MASQAAWTGDFSTAWLRSAGPSALLLRTEHSFLLTPATARWMADARPDTTLRELPACGHWLHSDDPAGFAEAVAGFPGQPTARHGHAARAPVSTPAPHSALRPSPNPITRAPTRALTPPHSQPRNPSLLTPTPHPPHLDGTLHSSPTPPLPPQVSAPPLQPLAATIFIARRHPA